jgi:hypothetical protein
MKVDQERDGRRCRPIVVKSWLSMHSANTGPGEARVTARPQLGKDALTALFDQIDRLTDAAARMLADEKDLN